LQAEQLPHSRLIVFPVERAQHALIVGDEHRDADRRLQAVEAKAFRLGGNRTLACT
jgi:hypothetical protein